MFQLPKNDVTMFHEQGKRKFTLKSTVILTADYSSLGRNWNCPNGRGSNPKYCHFIEEVMTDVGHSDEGNKDNSDDDDNDK